MAVSQEEVRVHLIKLLSENDLSTYSRRNARKELEKAFDISMNTPEWKELIKSTVADFVKGQVVHPEPASTEPASTGEAEAATSAMWLTRRSSSAVIKVTADATTAPVVTEGESKEHEEASVLHRIAPVVREIQGQPTTDQERSPPLIAGSDRLMDGQNPNKSEMQSDAEAKVPLCQEDKEAGPDKDMIPPDFPSATTTSATTSVQSSPSPTSTISTSQEIGVECLFDDLANNLIEEARSRSLSPCQESATEQLYITEAESKSRESSWSRSRPNSPSRKNGGRNRRRRSRDRFRDDREGERGSRRGGSSIGHLGARLRSRTRRRSPNNWRGRADDRRSRSRRERMRVRRDYPSRGDSLDRRSLDIRHMMKDLLVYVLDDENRRRTYCLTETRARNFCKAYKTFVDRKDIENVIERVNAFAVHYREGKLYLESRQRSREVIQDLWKTDNGSKPGSRCSSRCGSREQSRERWKDRRDDRRGGHNDRSSKQRGRNPYRRANEPDPKALFDRAPPRETLEEKKPIEVPLPKAEPDRAGFSSDKSVKEEGGTPHSTKTNDGAAQLPGNDGTVLDTALLLAECDEAGNPTSKSQTTTVVNKSPSMVVKTAGRPQCFQTKNAGERSSFKRHRTSSDRNASRKSSRQSGGPSDASSASLGGTSAKSSVTPQKTQGQEKLKKKAGVSPKKQGELKTLSMEQLEAMSLDQIGDMLDFGKSEVDPGRLALRKRQIEIGKNSKAYLNYRAKVSKKKRDRSKPDEYPLTPDPKEDVSNRRWKGKMSKWRRLLNTNFLEDDKSSGSD